MYLEISARRSGKGVRLIQAVRKQLSRENNAIIVYHSLPMLDACLPYDLKFHPRVKAITIERYLSSYSDVLGLPSLDGNVRYIISPNTKFFFDEFDLYRRKLPVNPEGYYVTTPSFLRNAVLIKDWQDGRRSDLLLDLLNFNKGMYAAHTWNLDVHNMYELSEEQFNLFFGQQLFMKSPERRVKNRRDNICQ